ncbi:hypothetical protein PIROE2DRAFT_3960 [Piromyces sp. E2]|nr:hypothetical protein PIROE2DRAFT_3960 [Piromyces sp. E2]|eukprot:OUM68362.1 hypothetical protein PIROE2DRAFT_3960 [Piromyces sp. E2]
MDINENFKYYKEMFSTVEYETPEIPMKIIKNNDNKNDLEGQERKVKTYQKNIDKILYNNINNYVMENNIKNNPKSDEIIESITSIQPILVNVPSDITFDKFINDNKEILLKVYENQLESLSELTEKLKLKKLNNCFIYKPENTSSSNEHNKFNQSEEFSKFDISFNEVIRHIEEFGTSVSNIEYIPDNEKNKIIYEFNSEKYEYENVKCYHTEFEKVAKEKPNDIAVIYNDTKINYKKLDEMSNSLGHLLRMKNVERNDIIPIITDRSPSFIVSTLAISKAGGAFLPIDKNLPDNRISYILSEVSPKLVLYNCNLSEIDIKIKEQYTLYDVNQHDYNENINQLDNINEVQDTCYILFTSGTTGKPKGTILTHYNLYNYIKRYPEESNSLYSLMKTNNVQNILGITNFSFDIYHNEITYSLCHGLTIVLVSQELSENIQELSQYIMKNSVDFINTTPTRFELFMENELFRNAMKHIKTIFLLGEKLPYSLCNEIHKYSNSNIYNGYGPTECTVICSYKHITDNNITIGKPITNKSNSLYSLMKTNNVQNILGITNFSFDIYHNEITYSLCHGLTIVLVSQELSENIQELSQYIMKNSVDFINTTPTRFELFMENELFRNAMKHIKTIFLLGEKLPYSLCNEIHKYSNSNIYNGYGPTECTVICSYKHITDNNITIGKPITNIFFEGKFDGVKTAFGRVKDDMKIKIEEYTKDNFEEFIRPYDITKDILIRIGIIDKSILMVDMNHAITDGFSMNLFVTELFKLYNGEILENQVVQYGDFAIKYNNEIKTTDYTNEIAYYKKIFIYKTTKQYNMSKAAYFLALHSLVLSFYSGSESVYSTIVDSNRTSVEKENIIGFLVKENPFAININRSSTLLDIIMECSDILLTLYDFDVPTYKVLDEIKLQKSDIEFKYDPYEMTYSGNENLYTGIDLDDVYKYLNKTNSITRDYEVGPFIDYFVEVKEMKDTFRIEFEYNADLYDETLIKNIIDMYSYVASNESLLKSTVDDIFKKYSVSRNEISLSNKLNNKNNNEETLNVNIEI